LCVRGYLSFIGGDAGSLTRRPGREPVDGPDTAPRGAWLISKTTRASLRRRFLSHEVVASRARRGPDPSFGRVAVQRIELAGGTGEATAEQLSALVLRAVARRISRASVLPIVLRAAAVTEQASGFDWGSAGIGVAAGVGAFAITLAGVTGMRRRRPEGHRSVATH
jgi:hypothetical protein